VAASPDDPGMVGAMSWAHPVKILRRFLPLWAILAGAGAQAALPETAPLPAVAAYAQARGIPISGVELAPEGEGPRAGDSVTLLVELSTGKLHRQWLAIVQAGKLDAAEQNARPPIGDVVRYTTTGNELRYRVTANAALQLRFIGPFCDVLPDDPRSAVPHEQSERILASPEFLGLGLDQTCRIWVRIRDNLRQIRAAGGSHSDLFLPLESSTARFPDSLVERTRAAAATINFTRDDERPFYGMELALEAFVRIIQSSPAAGKILGEMVERPSLWSTFTHLGIDGKVTALPQDIRAIDPAPWGIALPAYRLPFELSLNSQPALGGDLAVTAPRAPLWVCAGILEINATSPNDPGKRLLISVLAARRGAPALP